MLQGIAAQETHLLTGLDRDGTTSTGGDDRAFARCHNRAILGRSHFHAINAGFRRRQRRVGSIDLIDFAGKQPRNRNADLSLVDADLDGAATHGYKRHARLGVHAQEAITQIDFGA